MSTITFLQRVRLFFCLTTHKSKNIRDPSAFQVIFATSTHFFAEAKCTNPYFSFSLSIKWKRTYGLKYLLGNFGGETCYFFKSQYCIDKIRAIGDLQSTVYLSDDNNSNRQVMTSN